MCGRGFWRICWATCAAFGAHKVAPGHGCPSLERPLPAHKWHGGRYTVWGGQLAGRIREHVQVSVRGGAGPLRLPGRMPTDPRTDGSPTGNLSPSAGDNEIRGRTISPRGYGTLGGRAEAGLGGVSVRVQGPGLELFVGCPESHEMWVLCRPPAHLTALSVASKESAYVYAIASAGVTHSMARACAKVSSPTTPGSLS